MSSWWLSFNPLHAATSVNTVPRCQFRVRPVNVDRNASSLNGKDRVAAELS